MPIEEVHEVDHATAMRVEVLVYGLEWEKEERGRTVRKFSAHPITVSVLAHTRSQAIGRVQSWLGGQGACRLADSAMPAQVAA